MDISKAKFPNLTDSQISFLSQIDLPSHVYHTGPDVSVFPLQTRAAEWEGFLRKSPDYDKLPPPDKDGKRKLLYVGDSNTAGSRFSTTLDWVGTGADEHLVSRDSLDIREAHHRHGTGKSLQDFALDQENRRLYRINTEDVLKRLSPNAMIIRDEGQQGRSWAIAGDLIEPLPTTHIQHQRKRDGTDHYIDTSTGASVTSRTDIETLEPKKSHDSHLVAKNSAGHVAAGQRGHAHIGAMGLAATVLMGAAAFQEARAVGLDLKGQFKAAATAILPTGAAIAQGHTAEAIASIIDKEPTGILSNAARGVMRDLGFDVEEGALSAALKNKSPQQVIRDKQLNDRIGRDQTALFDPNHPDQLGALKVTDPKTGKKLDTARALKDPAQRHVVFDEIKRIEKSATTPDARETAAHMREAAQQFVDLEKRRRPVLDSQNYAMGTGPGVTKQIAASPVVGGPGGGPG